LQHGPFGICIDRTVHSFGISRGLPLTGGSDAPRRRGTWLTVAGQLQIAIGDRRHIDPQVKPI